MVTSNCSDSYSETIPSLRLIGKKDAEIALLNSKLKAAHDRYESCKELSKKDSDDFINKFADKLTASIISELERQNLKEIIELAKKEAADHLEKITKENEQLKKELEYYRSKCEENALKKEESKPEKAEKINGYMSIKTGDMKEPITIDLSKLKFPEEIPSLKSFLSTFDKIFHI